MHPKLVQDMLGYANISITLGTYSHVLSVMADVAAGAMDEALAKPVRFGLGSKKADTSTNPLIFTVFARYISALGRMRTCDPPIRNP